MSLKKTIADRFGLIRIYEAILKRRVPETPWFLGDGAALTLLLLIQVITGVTMALYYSNSAEFAYESVKFITCQLPLGWLVRGMHYWSAGMIVIMTAVHISRHLILGGYKAPREGTWAVGVFLLFWVLTMSYTGYVLRWDEEAFYAIRVVLNIFYYIPFIGDELVLFLQGGINPGPLTLTRFYSLHILLVPLLLAGFVGFHLYLVILHGVTHRGEWTHDIRSAEEHKKVYYKAAKTEEHGQWFYPDTAFVSGTVAFLIFCIAFLLAILIGPPELFPEANLVETSMPQEEWWFAWVSALVALTPPVLAPVIQIVIPLLVFITMLLLPILDRGPNRGLRKRPLWAGLVLFSVIGLLWLSDLRRRSPWEGWPDPTPPPVPVGVVLNDDAETGRFLFAQYGCNSCHAISSTGPKVGPDLAKIQHPFSPSELRQFILAPPKDVPMPSYRGRMSDDDLEKIIKFVLVAQTFPRTD